MFESEERRILRRIKDFIKSEKFPGFYNIIMLRDGRILRFDDYFDMINTGKITPKDTYVYIRTYHTLYSSIFYYPSLASYDVFLDIYLSKLGFDYRFVVVPATGLKYVTFVVGYRGYLTVELTNLDTVVNNTNLPKIVSKVLSKKLISGEKELTEEEYEKTDQMFKSQRLFAGYNSEKALDIIYNYYDNGKKSLAKKAARIAMDYYRIFNPYTVCYDMDSWKEVDCLSIKLD